MESTNLNTYTAPMYVVELLTKLLGISTGSSETVTEIGTTVTDIKDTVQEGITATNDKLDTANTAINTVSTKMDTLQTSVTTIDDVLDQASAKLDTINTSTLQVQGAVTALETEVVATKDLITSMESNIASMHSVMNPSHLFAVTEGDNTFAQPSVLKNITDANITIYVIPANGTEAISTVLYPGWNTEVVSGVQGATANTLQYGY